MELRDYLLFSLPGMVFEFLALISGLYYLKKDSSKQIKLWVAFLGFICFLEIFASYSVIGYFSEYKYFSFIKDSPFRRNNWIYNFYDIVNPIITCIFFIYYLKNQKFKKAMKVVLVVFFFSSIYFQFIKNSFFENSSVVVISGTFLIMAILFQFFYEILKSDHILKLKAYLPMYIAVGVFVFNLATTPLSIFSDYFNVSNGNVLFVKLQVYILLISNLFMYSCFTVGFLVCSKKKKYS